MNKKIIFTTIAIIVAMSGAYFLFAGQSTDTTASSFIEEPTSTPEPASAPNFAVIKDTDLNKEQKSQNNPPEILPADQITGKKAVITIKGKGVIEFEFLPEEAPLTVSNYITLAKNKFYDGLIFHRVIEGFMAQGGDPTGTGSGGPGYQFKDEPVKRAYTRGIVAMANSGPDTNGSQFFIMTKDTPLEPKYNVFGIVLKGQEVADSLVNGDVMESVVIANK